MTIKMTTVASDNISQKYFSGENNVVLVILITIYIVCVFYILRLGVFFYQ